MANQPPKVSPVLDFAIGDRIHDGYIVRDIKRGGMGVVYLCDSESLHVQVAIKGLSAVNWNSLELRRFSSEASHWISLKRCPYIVRAFYVKRIASRPFIFMERVDGGSLADRLKARPSRLVEHLDVAIQVARGLQWVHEAGLTHRDLKPSNVMMTPSGRAKLCDFGLAGTISGLPVDGSDAPAGTPAYMPPEQWRGLRTADPSADVYAFGVLLYEMLTGTLPFASAATVMDLYWAHVEAVPDFSPNHRAQLPTSLCDLVLACLGKAPSSRPDDATLLDRLGAIFLDVAGERWREPPNELPRSALIEATLTGLSLLTLQQLEGARHEFQRALAIDSDNPAVLAGLGECCYLERDFRAALEFTRRALAAKSDDPWLVNQYAAMLNELDRPEEALATLSPILGQAVTVWSAWNNAAVSLVKLGQWHAALQSLWHAIDLAPHEAEIWSNLGYVLDRLNRLQESFDAFERAIHLDPTFTRTYRNYARSLARNGRRGDALRIVSALLEIDPTDDEARHVQQRLTAC